MSLYENLFRTVCELKEEAERACIDACGGTEEDLSGAQREVMTKIIELKDAIDDLRHADDDPSPAC